MWLREAEAEQKIKLVLLAVVESLGKIRFWAGFEEFQTTSSIEIFFPIEL